MKVKQNLNRLIIAKVVEIIFVCAFLFLSFSLRETFINIQTLAFVPDKDQLNYTNLSVNNPLNYVMYPMKNSDALTKVSDTTLTVNNESLTKENYSLLLVVSKNSSLDYNCLNIAIDNQIYALNTLPQKEDNNSFYFILASDSIVGSQKEYKIKIWMDESTGNEMQNKKIILSYDIVKSVSI